MNFKKKEAIFLCFFITIAFFLRYYLIQQNLFFGPEQGLDFSVIRDIVISHKLTLIGAKTDIEGVFHGPFYYYLSVIPFILSKGNPLVVSAFLILINSLTIIPLYLATKELGSKKIGIFAVILFTVSYECIVFSRWLSTQPLSIPLTTLLILFLIKYLKGDDKYLISVGITFALLGQVEFINFLLFAPSLFLIGLLFRKRIIKTKKTYVLIFIFVTALLSWGDFLLFDIRHELLIIKSLLSLISGTKGYYVSLLATFETLGTQLFVLINNIVLPQYKVVAIFVFVLGFLYIMHLSKKKKELVILPILLVTPFFILFLLRHDLSEQLFVGVFIPIVLVASFGFTFIYNKNRLIGVVVVFAVVFFQLMYWHENIELNRNIFFQATQLKLRYKDQLEVIDEIYANAKEQKFSYEAFTIPYWKKDAWEYLFWYYGKKKYGYLPTTDHTNPLFVIIQRLDANPDYQTSWLTEKVTKWGVLENIFEQGILLVEQLRVQ